MFDLTPDLSAFAHSLRAELNASGAVDEILIETFVSAAVRLKILHADHRAFDPFDPTWIRAYNLAIRAFFRAYDTLNRRRSSSTRASSPSSRPVPSSTASTAPTTSSARSQLHPVEPQINAPGPQMVGSSVHHDHASPMDGQGPVDQAAPIPPSDELQSSRAPAASGSHPPGSTRPTPKPADPTFDEILRRAPRRDFRSAKIRLLENHVVRHTFDRIVAVSATPSRASPQ